MNLAVFTEFFENDKNSAGLHMSELVLELSKNFKTIDVFSLHNHESKIKRYNWPNNVTLHNLGYGLNDKSGSLFKRFFVELSISFRAIIYIYKIKKISSFDSIIWYSPTIFWSPVIFFLSIIKKTKIKKYLILRDIFPQWAVDLNLIKRFSIQNFILRIFEKMQYHVADIIGIQSKGNRE